jgi:formate hydrogenlyase subunit 6/NADH:ubiquinone oxidoreductase subunit I
MSPPGMSFITLKNLFSRPATRPYPRLRRPPFALDRGEIANDIGVCILCGICARVCPDQALAVSKSERSWEIDHLRCILCGLCVEVCPVRSLTQRKAAHGPLTGREKFKLIKAEGDVPERE